MTLSVEPAARVVTLWLMTIELVPTVWMVVPEGMKVPLETIMPAVAPLKSALGTVSVDVFDAAEVVGSNLFRRGM